jgi:hypothetical protein
MDGALDLEATAVNATETLSLEHVVFLSTAVVASSSSGGSSGGGVRFFLVRDEALGRRRDLRPI